MPRTEVKGLETKIRWSKRMRKQLTETVRDTKKQAEAVLREGLAAIDSGNYVPKETLSSSLWVTWKALTFTTAA